MSTTRKVLLFVLSSEALRSRFNQMLAATPHAAFYSFDGADGFDRFLEARPDLCFVSEATSRISGSILSQLIREHRLSKGCGVYMLSPRWQDQELVDRLKALGVDGVLPEPPDEAQLTEVLARDHRFAGESIDALEKEVVDSSQAPVPLPVAAAAGEVFSSGETRDAQILSAHLRTSARDPEKDQATPAAVVELTPAMQKLPDLEHADAASPCEAPARHDETEPGDNDSPPFAPLPTASHVSGSLENAMLSLAQVTLSQPKDAALVGDTTSGNEVANPFVHESNERIEATTAQHEVPADIALASQTAPPQNSEEDHGGAPDAGGNATNSADAHVNVGGSGPTPLAEGGVKNNAAHEEPTPVREVPVSAQIAAEHTVGDFSAVEEPTPVENHPVGSWDLDSANEDSDVFEKDNLDLADEATVRKPAAPPEDHPPHPAFASLEQPDPNRFTPTNTSGIYPLSAEERDSHTIRQAITDSQLGGRLTRRVLALYRLLDSVDYYQLLGVTDDADRDEVQKAYHALALEYHPDRFFVLNAGFIKERVAALFMRMTEAFTVLSHPERRARYDRLLSETHDGPPSRFVLGENSVDKSPLGSEAQTPVGRKYLRLAFAAMARGDLDAAHLNLTFAVGHEPANAHLRERLGAIESQLQSAH